MNSYLEYRQLDLPWLTSVPAHWEIWKNRRIFTEVKDEVGENSSEYQLLSLSKKGIIPRDMESGKGKFPAKFNKYKIVLPGYMAFCLFDMDETPRTVGLSTETGMLTGAYTIMRVDGINKGYAYYYYLALDDKKALKPLYTGLRKTINVNTFLGTKLPIPPRTEQDQIVRYLNWKTSEIARFVNEKRNEIELLTELKNSVISHAVLHGIKSNVEEKECSISWIHTIPKHWDEVSLFQCAVEQSVSNKNVHHQNLLSLSYGKIVNKDINTSTGLLPVSFDTYQLIYDGNVILRLTDLQNDHKSLRVGLATQTGIITSAYTCLKPRDCVIPEYLYLLLHSYDVSKVFYGMGGGVRQSIGYSDIRHMTLILPPKGEQQEIVDYCYSEQTKIEQMIDSIKSEITLVEELRTKIISDAVTGKVDVRGVEVPDFVLETEDTDEDEDVDADDENEEMEGEE